MQTLRTKQTILLYYICKAFSLKGEDDESKDYWDWPGGTSIKFAILTQEGEILRKMVY